MNLNNSRFGKENRMSKHKTIRITVKPKNDSKNKEVDNIVYMIKPLILVEYALGIFRFYCKNGELQKISTAIRCSGVCLFVLQVILAALILIYGFVSPISTFDFNVRKLYVFTHVADIVFIIIDSLPKYCERNIEIVKTLANFDKILYYDMPASERNTQRKLLCVLLTSFLFMITLPFLIDYFMQRSHLIIYLISYMYFTRVYLGAFTFDIYIAIVIMRLNSICKRLKLVKPVECPCVCFENEQTSAITSNDIHKIYDTTVHITSLMRAFNAIGITVGKVNNVFQGQIMMILISIFYNITFTQALWLHLYVNNIRMGMRYIPFVLHMLVVYLSFIFMCCLSQAIKSKRKNIKNMLNNQVVNYSVPKSVRIQCKLFLDVLEVHPLDISVYNMFSLNSKFMLSFLSLTASYLILIIQTMHLF